MNSGVDTNSHGQPLGIERCILIHKQSFVESGKFDGVHNFNGQHGLRKRPIRSHRNRAHKRSRNRTHEESTPWIVKHRAHAPALAIDSVEEP